LKIAEVEAAFLMCEDKKVPELFGTFSDEIKSQKAYALVALSKCHKDYIPELFEKLPPAVQQDQAAGAFNYCSSSRYHVLFPLLPLAVQLEKAQEAVEKCRNDCIPELFAALPPAAQRVQAAKAVAKCNPEVIPKLFEKMPAAVQGEQDKANRSVSSSVSVSLTVDFDFFISHYTKDDSHAVFQKVEAYISAKGMRVFNPTTHLSHVEKINKAAMQDAVRRSKQVLAGLSEGFFASGWCEAEIEAARDAGIKVIPCYSGEHHGANQVDKWVETYNKHAVFKYIFRENARDVLNKQNLQSVNATLKYLAELKEVRVLAN